MGHLNKQSFFASLVFIFLIQSQCRAYDSCSPKVELKAAYFIFANEKMRDTYDKGGYEVQLSSSYPLSDVWHIYGSVGFMEARGNSTHFKERTTFRQIPVDIGLKPVINISSCVDWYMAIGPRFYYAEQHNHSDFVNKHVRKGGVGLFINSGFDFTNGNFYVKPFVEYAYQPIRPSSVKHGTHRRSVQVGGYSFGVGLGFIL